jgi:endo-1,4-beta-xylanase
MVLLHSCAGTGIAVLLSHPALPPPELDSVLSPRRSVRAAPSLPNKVLMRSSSLSLAVLSSLSLFVGCGAGVGFAEDDPGAGGSGGGLSSSGGTLFGTGGAGIGGRLGSGGATFTSGGAPATGGRAGGGSFNVGGAPIGGGFTGIGGFSSSGGQGSSGGASGGGAGTGGAGTGGATTALDCNAAMPTSGAQQHSGNGQGGTGNLAWQIWSNMGTGDLVTYPVTAFRADWNNSGDYLGRIGYEWGGFGMTPKPYAEYGTITAEMVHKKNGTAGDYSYIGMYGWSTDPCVEWYIVDDSYKPMPFNPGNTTNKGEVDIDGGTYIMYTRNTTGTGGSRCSGVSNWVQYYSVRKVARQCGVIPLTEHFDAWKDLNMPLGVLLEAKILVEAGGGVGSVEFPVANVIATNP